MGAAASAWKKRREKYKVKPGDAVVAKPRKSQLMVKRVGLSDQEKDALDAAEEPMSRRYQDICWTCTLCGVALLDVWGESLCHSCHKRNDPKWKEARIFAKPVVVYARKTSKDEERRGLSHSSTSPPRSATPTSRPASPDARSPSKGSDALMLRSSSKHGDAFALRSSSKTSLALQDEVIGRSNTKKSTVSSHVGSDTNGGRPSSPSMSGSKAHDGHDGPHHHHHHHHATTKDGLADVAGAEVKKEEAHAAPPPAPPPFSEFQGSVQRGASKSQRGASKSHLEGGHHHHHHHHKHEEETRQSSKAILQAKRANKHESQEQLAKLTDLEGKLLAMGDRVIGEGKIGDDMGIGTITGANTSHGHGMVVVQFDSGGHAHPMKAEHMKKLEAKDEADVAKRLEKAKKDKAKH